MRHQHSYSEPSLPNNPQAPSSFMKKKGTGVEPNVPQQQNTTYGNQNVRRNSPQVNTNDTS